MRVRRNALLGRGVNLGVFRHITSRSGTLGGRVGGLGHCCVPSVLLAVNLIDLLRSLVSHSADVKMGSGRIGRNSHVSFLFHTVLRIWGQAGLEGVSN